MASADFSLRFCSRHPFRRKARPPQVRYMAFAAQSSDLHRRPLVARVSRLRARSPWTSVPLIRFLSVNSQLRYPLLSA